MSREETMTLYGWNERSPDYHVIEEPRKGWHEHLGPPWYCNGERWIDEWGETPPTDRAECRCVTEAIYNEYRLAARRANATALTARMTG